MSSTEQDAGARLAAALFDDLIVPTARAAGSGAPFFPLAGDARPSYYEAPLHRTMNAAELELPGDGEGKALIAALAERWRGEGDAALLELIPRLEAVAAALAVVEDEQGEAVSHHVYTMF